MSGLDS